MKAPCITVLVATADRPELLSDCLAHLCHSRFRNVEIIVLDQSRPAPALQGMEIGSPFLLRHVQCQRRGKSAALNLGIAQARGDLIAFTDDDCRVAEDWFEVMHRAFLETQGRMALTGRVLPGEPEGDSVIAPSLQGDAEAREYHRPGFRDVLFGNNMAIPARLLRRVGAFDEAFGPGTSWPAAEDNDLGYRLLRALVPIRYLPDLVVTHRSWRGARQQRGVYRDYGIGQGAFYGKHARCGDLRMVARLARNLWDVSRGAGGAVLLGRGHDLRASLCFSRGLVRGFLRAALAPAGASSVSLQTEEP